jgi:hypothetical protein
VPAKTSKRKTHLRDKGINPYPYRILPAKPPAASIIKRLDPLAVIQFFRIEALLRSEGVMERYKRKQCEHNKLLWHEHSIIDDVLNGVHHRLLSVTVREPLKGCELENAGITDLSTLSPAHLRGESLTARGPDGQSVFHYVMPGLLASIESKHSLWLYLRIDLRYPLRSSKKHSTCCSPVGTRNSI